MNEGETECESFWWWGIAAMGITGSAGWIAEFAELPIVQNAKRVFISQDQKDGAPFVTKILRDLPQAFVLRWPKDVNDPSDLHLKYADVLDEPGSDFQPNPFIQSVDIAIQAATLEKALRQPKTDK